MSSLSLLVAIPITGDTLIDLRSGPPSMKWNRLLCRRVPGIFLKNHKTIRFCTHLALKMTATKQVSSRSCEKKGSPWVRIVSKVFETLKCLKKPAITTLLVGVLLSADPFLAIAASGGRMGGRAFSSSSSSSPSYSMSYSAPSCSGFSYDVPYYVPCYAPSPLKASGGICMEPAVGVRFGAGSWLSNLMMGFTAFVFLSEFLSDRSDDGGVLTAAQKTSILKLQVGVLGMARSFQKELDRIAETADTSTSEGLNYILTETVLALLRHPDCCISAHSYVDAKRSAEDGDTRFNQLSLEERGKFDEETLVNVNNIKRHKTTSLSSKFFSNEYIVITILVAAKGVHKLPDINSGANLKAALQSLGSIPATKTMAVEVLWTPQDENDTLSERDLLENYPLLRPM